ncbi:hypothetical protein CEXT_705771 [Caerostris extrusa]|uniref:Uncharacterized protein n=1 Tax=Caerostris extrusa TaxID=172846 RepID=A0AAV4SE21_CAEEX|nr:hypothetical protein CEXT_705771 [Caerostris extrusa]
MLMVYTRCKSQYCETARDFRHLNFATLKFYSTSLMNIHTYIGCATRANSQDVYTADEEGGKLPNCSSNLVSRKSVPTLQEYHSNLLTYLEY